MNRNVTYTIRKSAVHYSNVLPQGQRACVKMGISFETGREKLLLFADKLIEFLRKQRLLRSDAKTLDAGPIVSAH